MQKSSRIKNVLEGIGLTQSEAKCYLALIEMGPLTIQELAQKTGIHRVNLYQVIRGLEAKGAIMFEMKSKYRKRIIPNNPRQLLELVQKKQRVLKKAELKFKEAVPELAGLLQQAEQGTSVRYFEGLDGVKQVFNDILTATTEVKGFSNVDNLYDLFPLDWMDDYRHRKSELGIRGKFILPDGKVARSYIQEAYLKHGLRNYPELRVLPTKTFTVFAEIDIYDNKLNITSFRKDEPIGVIIDSKIVSKSFESIFDTMWSIAEPI